MPKSSHLRVAHRYLLKMQPDYSTWEAALPRGKETRTAGYEARLGLPRQFDGQRPFERKRFGTGKGKAADSSGAKLFPRNSYLNKFFAEKRIPSRMFEITDSHGIVHSIPNDVVVEAIAQTSGRELAQIENTIRQIDFKNGDVNHFLRHLAGALAEQYSGTLRFAGGRQAGRLRAPSSPRDDVPLTDRQDEDAWNAGYEAASYFHSKGRPVKDSTDVFLWVVENDRRVPNVKEGEPSFWEWVHAVGEGAQAYNESVGARFRMASEKRAFNKYNPDDLLSALVEILDKYDLDDAVKAVKEVTPTVQQAWRDRER